MPTGRGSRHLLGWPAEPASVLVSPCLIICMRQGLRLTRLCARKSERVNIYTYIHTYIHTYTFFLLTDTCLGVCQRDLPASKAQVTSSQEGTDSMEQTVHRNSAALCLDFRRLQSQIPLWKVAESWCSCRLSRNTPVRGGGPVLTDSVGIPNKPPKMGCLQLRDELKA